MSQLFTTKSEQIINTYTFEKSGFFKSDLEDERISSTPMKCGLVREPINSSEDIKLTHVKNLTAVRKTGIPATIVRIYESTLYLRNEGMYKIICQFNN